MINAKGVIKGLRLFVLLGSMIGTAACSTVTVKSSAKYDPNFDYARFKTFNWMPKSASSENLQQTAAAAEVGQMIESEVEKGLEARGFNKSTAGKPDFYLNYHARVQTRVEPQVVTYNCGRGICGQGMDMNQVREGTLILDIIQADSNDVVWQGTAVAEVGDPSRRKEIIETAVRQLLSVFPPK
ncbi:MAG TPA: DUF4136 domain-containing protein [Nitrospiria bacterium]|nr:DUF4136 domain-containing protein [Nitrospiria bacterium]